MPNAAKSAALKTLKRTLGSTSHISFRNKKPPLAGSTLTKDCLTTKSQTIADEAETMFHNMKKRSDQVNEVEKAQTMFYQARKSEQINGNVSLDEEDREELTFVEKTVSNALAQRKDKLGDTIKTIHKPKLPHAKNFSRERTNADIATIKATVPLDYVNQRLNDQNKRLHKKRNSSMTMVDSRSENFYNLSQSAASIG